MSQAPRCKHGEPERGVYCDQCSSGVDDKELLDWVETTKAQVWYDKYNSKWSLFLPIEKAYPIQPSDISLRGVILCAKNQFDNLA